LEKTYVCVILMMLLLSPSGKIRGYIDTSGTEFVRVIIFVRALNRSVEFGEPRSIDNVSSFGMLDRLLDKYRRDTYVTLRGMYHKNMGLLAEFIEGIGGRIIHKIYSVGALSAEVPRSKLPTILALDYVYRIARSTKFKVQMDIATKAIGADTFWNAMINGSNYPLDEVRGVEIAIVDTGIYLGSKYLRDRIIDSESFVADEPPDDLNGHGTLVANIIAGGDTRYRGVAYGANLINAKAMNRNGEGDLDDIMAAIEWAVTNASDTAEIINLSISAPGEADGSSELTMFIDWISYMYRVLIVVPVGNVGPGKDTVAIPGDSFNGITVGAIDDRNTLDRGDDHVASISCHGPTMDGRFKPDVVAPGVNLATFTLSDEKVNATGTSFSAALVSGSAALILGKIYYMLGNIDPVLAMKSLLILGADDILDTGADNISGFGYISLKNTYRWSHNVYEVAFINTSERFFVVDLSGGENLRITITWWRIPKGEYLEFYDVDAYIVTVLNPMGKVVCNVSSGPNNVLRIDYNTDTGGRFLVKITRIMNGDPSKESNIVISSNHLLREVLPGGSLSIDISSKNRIMDSETYTATITARNVGNSTIDSLTLNLYSDKLRLNPKTMMIEHMDPGDVYQLNISCTPRLVGETFIQASALYYVGDRLFSQSNYLIIDIVDDDVDPPTIILFDAEIYLNKIGIKARVEDPSGVSAIYIYWDIEKPQNQTDPKQYWGVQNLSYDPTSSMWIGTIDLKLEWLGKNIYLLLVTYDNDTDTYNDESAAHSIKTIRYVPRVLIFLPLPLCPLVILLMRQLKKHKSSRKNQKNPQFR